MWITQDAGCLGLRQGTFERTFPRLTMVISCFHSSKLKSWKFSSKISLSPVAVAAGRQKRHALQWVGWNIWGERDGDFRQNR